MVRVPPKLARQCDMKISSSERGKGWESKPVWSHLHTHVKHICKRVGKLCISTCGWYFRQKKKKMCIELKQWIWSPSELTKTWNCTNLSVSLPVFLFLTSVHFISFYILFRSKTWNLVLGKCASEWALPTNSFFGMKLWNLTCWRKTMAMDQLSRQFSVLWLRTQAQPTIIWYVPFVCHFSCDAPL